MHGTGGFSEDNINYIHEMITLLNSKITADHHAATSDVDTSLYRVWLNLKFSFAYVLFFSPWLLVYHLTSLLPFHFL